MGISDIETEDGKILFTAVNGHVDMKRIPYGTYTLKEEKAPNGYLSLMERQNLILPLQRTKGKLTLETAMQ